MIKYSQLSSTFSYSGKATMRSGKKKSLVGDPINFRGMANAPVNEAGVVALFSMVARDLRHDEGDRSGIDKMGSL